MIKKLVYVFIVVSLLNLINAESEPKSKSSSLEFKDILVSSFEENPGIFAFHEPVSITADRIGNMYVLDVGYHCVVKFGPDGNFIKHWGEEGLAPGMLTLSFESTIRTGIEGNLYVIERRQNQRISVFSTDGKFIDSFAKGMLANSISFLKNGNAIISTSDIYRDINTLHIFDNNFHLIKSFSSCKSHNLPNFVHDNSVVVDNEGFIYQVFHYYPYIRKFNPDGSQLFEKEYSLFVLSEYTGKMFKDYNFNKPPNKRENAYIQIFKNAVFFNGKIYLVRLDGLLVLNTNGLTETFISIDGDLLEEFGLLRDICFISKNSFLLSLLTGPEFNGISLFNLP